MAVHTLGKFEIPESIGSECRRSPARAQEHPSSGEGCWDDNNSDKD